MFLNYEILDWISFMAIFLSRALPSRMASTRASNSYSIESALQAWGTALYNGENS